MLGSLRTISSHRMDNSRLARVLPGLLVVLGCQSDVSPPAPPVAASPRSARVIVERSGREFQTADFLKPRREDSDPFLFGLAPLILQEVGDDEAGSAEANRFGRLKVDEDGELVIDRSKPTVYFRRSTTTLSGRDHETLAFVWFYAPPSSEAVAGESAIAQGVRLTLDSRGFPAVQEILHDRSGVAILYVSETLETAAREEHGEANPPRNFAVESEAGWRAGFVVARVLRDGPQPMGPWVYLEGGSRDVVTLLCRCMTSQVEGIRENTEYEFRPLSEIEELGIEPPSWPGSRVARRSLETCIRLPSEF